MTKEIFVKTHYPFAEIAGKKYNINPTVILAQAAHESGWGSSYAARVRKNFFGIIARNVSSFTKKPCQNPIDITI